MIVLLLIVHGLMAVILLGAVSHQAVSTFIRAPVGSNLFLARYAAASPERFTRAVVVLYILVLVVGGMLYPSYRIDVRIPFEQLGLRWAVGLFELKEHLAALGLGLLPLYARMWQPRFGASHGLDGRIVTAFLAGVIWFDFIVGHILNNIRGLT